MSCAGFPFSAELSAKIITISDRDMQPKTPHIARDVEDCHETFIPQITYAILKKSQRSQKLTRSLQILSLFFSAQFLMN